MMNHKEVTGGFASIVLAALTWSDPAHSQAVETPYPEMAPIEQYRFARREDEIALARTAAPPSISADADVLVLGSHGYETAAKGTNGFVCFIERSWAADFADPEFWNPKLRAPNCFNPAAARTQLPRYLKRTEWVLAGATKEQIIERTKAAVASHSFKPLEAGAFSFMLSKHGYVSDVVAGPWLPHVMFFIPHGAGRQLGREQARFTDPRPRGQRSGNYSPVRSGTQLVRRLTCSIVPQETRSHMTQSAPR